MKLTKILSSAIWFTFGSMVSMMMLDLRFKNSYLRRELILEMQGGANYFSMFVIIDIFTLIVLYGLYFWYNRRKHEKKTI